MCFVGTAVLIMMDCPPHSSSGKKHSGFFYFSSIRHWDRLIQRYLSFHKFL